MYEYVDIALTIAVLANTGAIFLIKRELKKNREHYLSRLPDARKVVSEELIDYWRKQQAKHPNGSAEYMAYKKNIREGEAMLNGGRHKD